MINFFKENGKSKAEIEALQLKQRELKLIGSFVRTKGLKLFAYNTVNEQVVLIESEIERNKSLQLVIRDGKLEPEESYLKNKLMYSDGNIYFEALNQTAAEKRVKKHLGNLDLLSNLKPYTENTIKLF